MSYSMWGALAETPWWIYLSLIWFLLIAWFNTQPKILNFKTIAVYPFILIISMLVMLPIVIDLTQLKAGFLLVAIFPGLVVGYIQFYFSGIKAIRHTSQFYLPGSWGMFVFLGVLILVKAYYANYSLDLDLSLLKQNEISTFIVILCGFATGMQIAKTLGFYRRMKVGPFREST